VLRRPVPPPAALRCLQLAVPSRAHLFAPGGAARSASRPRALVTRCPLPGLWNGKERASQVPGCTSWCACPALRPRRNRSARPLRHYPCCLPLSCPRRLPRGGPVEAAAHGLRPRGLRFAGWVTPPPRKPRFRRAATLSRTGLSTCKVHDEEFPSDCCYVISSSLPRLCLAQQALTLFPPKPDFIRLAHQGCHPERSEGSRGEILRYAQNDTAERSQREVYQCHAFQFS